MISKFCVVLLIVNIFVGISALVELPQVEENNILKADKFIRKTANKLFSLLKLTVNERPALTQYSLIQNYLASTIIHDYTNLIEVAKLTRIDKTKISNQTQSFMAVLNDILDEDIKHDIETEDEIVLRHIEGFLKNLDKYTDTYNYKEYNEDIIIVEILKHLENNDTLSDVHLDSILDNDNKTLGSRKENETTSDDSEFWVPNARRIFHGKKTNIKDFPFMASIQVFNHFQCAGSIIKSDLIITAASCLQLAWNNRFFRENPAFLSARVGSSYHNGGGENIPVFEAYFHPEYDPISLRHNLCLLRLDRSLHFSKRIRRIKKIDIDRNANPLPTNTDGITIVGWGARQRDQVIKAPYLSFAVLDFYSLDECREVYASTYVTNHHFCAGFMSIGSGACNRDIGGPGIVHGVLSGVVSFGSSTCGTPNAPTVFTKLGYYTDWIENVMYQDVPFAKKKTTMTQSVTYNIPDHETVKSTFKVTPLASPRKPLLLEIDNLLRISESNNLLKEFINAIIKSEDEKSKTNKENSDQFVDRTPFRYSPVTTLEPFELPITKSEEISYESAENDTNEPYELTNKLMAHVNATINMNKEIFHESVAENLQLNTTLDDGIEKTIDELNDGSGKLRYNFPTHVMTAKDKIDIMNNNDSQDVLDTFSDKGDNESGLEIAFYSFNDSNNINKDAEDYFISEQEMLQIVSDALKEELKNKSVIESHKTVSTLSRVMPKN